MNTNNLKKYAPQARRDFMAAVSQRLNQFGIHADGKGKLTVSTPVFSGSVMQIEGLSFDAGLARARDKLAQRAEQMGFEALVEQMAYTWFNRLSAIRFMELHGYLDHNLRVLSHPEKANSFEILDHAQNVAADLGLDRNHIVELKLAGNKDEELYRTLLLGQCHQLHQAMPFLFEALDDETELLLPDNLTRTDSILRGLVDSIPEEDWQQVEIIGWLYQFYISEKKDQVIGSVVKSEDIPAATQLFTPNWIVKYLVQNSVGRQWLMTYPDSGLKARMEYYIEPAEQEPSVVDALAAITPTSIDPETLKILDPACGSGHILVEAYDILKAIYEERGYRVRDIPKLILEKNLYGLDIDDRAAQLAGFALMMKAREDDRRIFTRDIKLNVLAIQSTQHLDLPDLWRKLALNQDAKRGSMESIFDNEQSNLADTVDDIEFKQLRAILELFEQAKTLGSLIQVPYEQAEYLRNFLGRLQELAEQGDTMQKPAANALLPYVHQSWLLADKYDAVVANPPYMGSKGMNSEVKQFSKSRFSDSKNDLFAIFIERGFDLCKSFGFHAMVTMQSWLFLTSFASMRARILKEHTIELMLHMGNGVMGIAFGTAATVIFNKKIHDFSSKFTYCENKDVGTNNIPTEFPVINDRLRSFKVDRLDKIPGKPIAYWISDTLISKFENNLCIGDIATPRKGMVTADNDRFVRLWSEVSINKTSFYSHSRDEALQSKAKWFPYHKGGPYRLWYGNHDWLVNWENDGAELLNMQSEGYKVGSTNHNLDFIFKPLILFSKITSSFPHFRFSPHGCLFDDTSGLCYLKDSKHIYELLGFLCSNTCYEINQIINPTMAIQPGNIASLPYISVNGAVNDIVNEGVRLSKEDWDSFETSWEFKCLPLVEISKQHRSIEECWNRLFNISKNRFESLKNLQEKNNRIFIDAYGLENELSPDVPSDQVSVQYADRENDSKNLISYAIGCIMARYSLDEPGLIYAHAGNVDFDPSRYSTFLADEDGILPLTDQEWFKDDATNRFREFLVAVWGENTLQQNLEFVAESLTLSSFKPKKGETSLDTVRRYLSNQFYKDHLQTYKKRPIYWLFSSGKQKAFECLVYLHRYNESTLARMRTEYVTPLLGKYSAYADQLNQQLQDASSSEATRIKKDIQALEKKQTELRQFDDKLKHHADMRIKIDLDDGVKVNYGKFGDLLAEVKAVTGGAGD
ncbi:MAG: BREX-1 system adenine-specific DNA-methyltransferase PglX [Methylomonas sp.]|nr:BREX-1 system adenine-specific DNA-methyltransferase PglX [Methylomonas sp.]PPD21712.1 MAG: SAM-dependent methyltransferase [Methylomonas sp.]